MSEGVELSVSEFVAGLNQTLEFAYGSVVIHGELANFRVSKKRWVYFDLKDQEAKVSFFGTIYNLPGPLEEGMMLKVRGTPRLHPLYGFSVSVISISPMGSGSIKRSSDLLAEKLKQEGLFSPERKRELPYPPHKIALITSMQSAAFADFNKIINERWSGVEIACSDVSVQGEHAQQELIRALEYYSALADPPEVIVLIRGGGSPEDLASFSNEHVVRAVAASRVPTLVAIGHENDISLAELAADKRASTPSNAAELLVPDKNSIMAQLNNVPTQMRMLIEQRLDNELLTLKLKVANMPTIIFNKLLLHERRISDYTQLLVALSPKDILKRGYAIIRSKGVVSDGTKLKKGDLILVELARIKLRAEIAKVESLYDQ